jgi:hypothetical protein
MYKQGRPPFVFPKENPQALSLLPIFFRSHKGERSGQAAPIPQPPADPGGRSLTSAHLHLPSAPLPGRNPRPDNRQSGIAPQLRPLRPKCSPLKPSCRQAPPAARVERMALSGFSLHCVPFKPHNMPISQARELLAFHFTPFPRSLADPPIQPLYKRKCSMWQGAFASSPHLAYAAYPPWFQSPPVQHTSLPCSGFAFPAKRAAWCSRCFAAAHLSKSL